MKQVIFAFFDKELKSFGGLRLSNLNVDNLIQDLRRAILKGFDVEKCNQFVSQAIYQLGSYDDDSGVISSKVPELLLDCDQVLLERQQIETERKKKEVLEDE